MKRAPRPIKNSPERWQIPPLLRDQHKYQRGHVLLFGGALMTGAAKLAAHAAQRAGAGVVTLASPRRAWPIYAMSTMSIITRPLDSPADWQWILDHRKITTVLLGPGAEPKEVLGPLRATQRAGLPMVLDAGALQLLAENGSARRLIIPPRVGGRLKGGRSMASAVSYTKTPPQPSPYQGGSFVLTPHDGEYQKLAVAFGLAEEPSRPKRALALAQATGGIVVLKGPDTYIAAPDGRLVHHPIDTPHLATAGTGDVLAGIIAGLWAQGMDGFDAACAGVWLHAQAAQEFARGMVAEDLIGALPRVFSETSS